MDKIYKIFCDIMRCFVISCAIALLILFFDERYSFTKENARVIVWSAFAVLLVLLFINIIISMQTRDKKAGSFSGMVNSIGDTVLTNKEIADYNKRISSIHEAGHAVMSYLKEFEQYDAYVTNTNPRVVSVFKLMNAEDLRNYTMMIYAGAAAEEIFFGSFYSGGVIGEESDFKKAVNCMKTYLMMTHSDISKACLDEEVSKYIKKLSNDIYGETLKLLSQNKQMVETIAKALEERNMLTTREIKELLENMDSKE